jgi:hypothetical protein
MTSGQCLCGAHRFELAGKLEFNHHCHCGYCRKHHGSAFASLVGVSAENLTWEKGEVVAFVSPSGFTRESCATCGTPLPQVIEGMPIFVPAGCLGAIDAPFEAHIFTGSKAEWHSINDELPSFDTYPPGIESEALATKQPLDPPGGVRGSCLCGGLTYVIDGPATTARHCHCTRCRKARGAAHASNLVVPQSSLRFTRGEDLVRRYKVPDAKYFTQCFCSACGAAAPMVDSSRKIAVIPLGGLDDAPPIAPVEHIWTADVPNWNAITDDLPQRKGPPEG